MKFHGQGLLVVALLLGWLMHQEGGRKHLPRTKPDWPENGSKRPNSGSTGFGEFFKGFGAENECFGSSVLFGTQN